MLQKQQGTRKAVIDIGSNTFHLLIVDINTDQNLFSEVYRQREFIYLAQHGMALLSDSLIDKALLCLKSFKDTCDSMGVSEITAVGTATIRNISNSHILLEKIKDKTGIDVEVIEGTREAELIYLGNRFGLGDLGGSVIQDIGGGSVELIFVEREGNSAFYSFKIGISQLRHLFPVTDFEQPERVMAIETYLLEQLAVIDRLKAEGNFTRLIGASGPFEILENLEKMKPSQIGNIILRDTAMAWCRAVINKNHEERLNMPDMPANRADLSLESMLLVKVILDLMPGIQHLVISPFSMKEGLIAERYFRLV